MKIYEVHYMEEDIFEDKMEVCSKYFLSKENAEKWIAENKDKNAYLWKGLAVGLNFS